MKLSLLTSGAPFPPPISVASGAFSSVFWTHVGSLLQPLAGPSVCPPPDRCLPGRGRCPQPWSRLSLVSLAAWLELGSVQPEHLSSTYRFYSLSLSPDARLRIEQKNAADSERGEVAADFHAPRVLWWRSADVIYRRRKNTLS